MADQDNNVLPLKLKAVPKLEQSDTLAPEQRLKLDSIAEASKFLMDNSDAINYFVIGVALNNPSDADNSDFHIITSPIDLPEYALALRLLDISFNRALTG